MAEVIAAARALGLDLSDELIDFNIERTRPMGPYRTSSMIDFVEGSGGGGRSDLGGAAAPGG